MGKRLWNEQHGQSLVEYAAMLAILLLVVVGAVSLVGKNANQAFSAVNSSITGQ